MTEWQKLIENGFLNEDFFNEEIICDYKVTTELKKIWAIELDLLREFKRVCDKYNLTYYAYAGTLLGAVRHKGFIPWDDDIDVCMPRRDYDLLTKVYADEFKTPYFMQTPYTDSEYSFSFAKIRNVNTCFAAEAFIESPMNQGVFLDIFPLDDSSIDGLFDRREKIMAILKKCSAFMSRNNKYIHNKHSAFAKELSFNKGDNIELYEKIQSVPLENKSNLDSLAVEVCTIYSSEKNLWPKEYYKDSMEVPFCNTTIRVPKEYDKVLSVMYKDYMEFPPLEKRGLWHNGVIKDLDRPFDTVRSDYLKKTEITK